MKSTTIKTSSPEETPERGYTVKSYTTPVKRYCQTLDLKDDPELIEQYIRCHSEFEA